MIIYYLIKVKSIEYIMDIKEKIQQYLDLKGINNSRFEASIGASNSYWRNTKSISAEILSKIFRIYSDINMEWVLLDKGEMLNCNTTYEKQSSPITPERLLSIIESQQRTIENLSKK